MDVNARYGSVLDAVLFLRKTNYIKVIMNNYFTEFELGQSYDIIREMQILWDKIEPTLAYNSEQPTDIEESEAYWRMRVANNMMIGSCAYWSDKRRSF